jgi:predicted ribosome-associated RNA-binding protein Tma20
MAEGKQHAVAVGVTTMSTDDMYAHTLTHVVHSSSDMCVNDWCLYSKKINKGIGVDNMHYIGDDLWHFDSKSLNLK